MSSANFASTFVKIFSSINKQLTVFSALEFGKIKNSSKRLNVHVIKGRGFLGS